ncbi:MAG: hypothetical protein Edafosvirus47_4 [Edafosvirus sp.]|uniref:Uncharacterized protein n=1 Tax=Edafosvirus sp. TaxID=2487765 RepID=A0A3G4ZVH7_9VIRU|nr:MAG: hypothetical protein Edafosvirus47_4 [Edafosvirus sp.]
MNTLDFILIIIIGIVIYVCIKETYYNTSNKNNQHYDNIPNNQIINKPAEEDNVSNFVDNQKSYDLIEEIKREKKINKKNRNKEIYIERNINKEICQENEKLLKPYFNNIVFNNDYRDVITAFDNIAPKQRQIFNIANIPVKYSLVDPSEVSIMINDFICLLNKNIITDVTEERTVNSGWDEAVPEPNLKSGWDKLQESLGLPASLYNKPAKNSRVALIFIKRVEKYETEDETKYVCFLILQKMNVNEQMIIKLSLVQDNRSITDERNFFVNSQIETKVVIEEIFIIGYLSENGIEGCVAPQDNFYNFEGLEKSDMMDQKLLMREMMAKYKEKTREMNHRNLQMGKEQSDLNNHLEYLYNADGYQATQTIFDDMQANRKFS